jgi:uncharacterized membrane protein
MEVLIFLAFVLLLILVFNIQSRLRNNRDDGQRQFSALKKQLNLIQEQLDQLKSSAPPAVKPADQEKEATELKAQEEYKQKIAAIEELNKQREEKRKIAEEEKLKQVAAVVEVEETIEAPKQFQQTPPIAHESWFEKWLKNNPDLEKFIGENLFNKIGIAVLVFGIGFFVKYAIDKDWINEYGRVTIGTFCGIVLVGLAHYLRNTYRSFSSVLAGGGLAVFYFTVALAFHEYHILSQQAAFILMIIITAFAVALSVLYDKLELAVIAVVGGFLTPFLVSKGESKYIILFTYLIILNIGLLVLSWFKKWPLINILALFFTILIYGGWMIVTFGFGDAQLPYTNAFLFATAFYVIFLGMNMLHNISRHKPFKALDFSVLLLINVTYYAAGMIILKEWHNGDYQGLFTVCLGALNLGLAIYFFRVQKADRNLLYLLIGLTLTYLSLTAPVQLHGHGITLFWCAETVLLLWLYERSRIFLFKLSSALIMTLMLISLGMDWAISLSENEYAGLPLIFSDLQGVITNIMGVASFTAYALLLWKNSNKDDIHLLGVSNKVMSLGCIAAAIILAYITCFFGINLYFGNATDYTLPNVYHRILSYGFVITLMLVAFRKHISLNTLWLQLFLLMFCLLYYAVSSYFINKLRIGVNNGTISSIHLFMHWISDVLLFVLIYMSVRMVRKNQVIVKSSVDFLSWAFSVVLVYVLSVECKQLYATIFNGALPAKVLQHQYMKAGLTILWGVCSFVFMWLGMKHRYKALRIISITLFGITLLKLFIFDIRNIGAGGKIAAFIMLGVLLLIVSFMYQRLKKLLIDDSAE